MSTTAHRTLGLRQTTSTSIPTTSYQACTWLGNCLGASCTTNDDCDNDWICANKICSLCCDSSRETSSSIATTTTTLPIIRARAVNKPRGGVDATTAIAVGVAIVIFFILGAGIGFWVWQVKRRKQQIPEAPTSNDGVGSHVDTPGYFADDRKRLVEANSREELRSPIKPTELPSMELVELEGDSNRTYQSADEPPAFSETPKTPVTVPERTVLPQRQPRYRFEEYGVHPSASAPELLWYSPVEEASPKPSYVQPSVRRSYQTHSSAGEDGVFIAGDGAEDGAEDRYIMFRWPRSSSAHGQG